MSTTPLTSATLVTRMKKSTDTKRAKTVKVAATQQAASRPSLVVDLCNDSTTTIENPNLNPIKRKYDDIVSAGETSRKLIKCIQASDVDNNNTLVTKILNECRETGKKDLQTAVNAFMNTLREQYGYIHSVDTADCNVCYESLCSKPAGLLKCGHVFCKQCLDIIRLTNPNGLPCPKCRKSSSSIHNCILGA